MLVLFDIFVQFCHGVLDDSYLLMFVSAWVLDILGRGAGQFVPACLTSPHLNTSSVTASALLFLGAPAFGIAMGGCDVPPCVLHFMSFPLFGAVVDRSWFAWLVGPRPCRWRRSLHRAALPRGTSMRIEAHFVVSLQPLACAWSKSRCCCMLPTRHCFWFGACCLLRCLHFWYVCPMACWHLFGVWFAVPYPSFRNLWTPGVDICWRVRRDGLSFVVTSAFVTRSGTLRRMRVDW